MQIRSVTLEQKKKKNGINDKFTTTNESEQKPSEKMF